MYILLVKWRKQDFKKSFFFLFKQVSWLKDYYKMVEKLVIPELNARNDTMQSLQVAYRQNKYIFFRFETHTFVPNTYMYYVYYIYCLPVFTFPTCYKYLLIISIHKRMNKSLKILVSK